ncbi:LysM peptidoglycan-binding domain-containing protein [Neobacillus pocheonensis]|uniref:LysM peptidoglycan-binding domain-containing protein n=1 Tax=Neobacillus pocheonensis TaxID=363869 RepID=UPI003D28C4BB
MILTTKELFANEELVLSRKETHGKSKQPKSVPEFTSRMEKREYYRDNYFNIRNVLDIKEFLNDIHNHWDTYVSQVHRWIQKNSVKKLVVTGIFTLVLSFTGISANAAFIHEYTYQVKSGDSIDRIAADHGVTAKEILDANGVTSIDGKKILLPKVVDRTVTATTLNVRSYPNTESSILRTYKKGDVVKVSFVENGWAGILIKGRVCYVKVDYLSSVPSQAADTGESLAMYVTADSLRVRVAASTSSEVLGTLKLNDQVKVQTIANGWAQITFNSKAAFVNEAFLTKKEPIQTSSSEYVIKSGDTFTKIAKALGVSVSSIQELNPNVDSSKLKIGQKINIPALSGADTNRIQVTAHIGGVDPQGTFRFITSDGRTNCAKASGNMIYELFNHQGKKVTLTLEGKRGQQLTLIALQ